MGVYFTCHPQLYVTLSSWIRVILPIITLLIRYFRLQYICLISYRDITKPCLLACFYSLLTAIDPAWHLSIHILFSSSVGDSISCFCSLLYLSPNNVSSSVPFFMYLLLYPSRLLPAGYFHFLMQVLSVYFH